LEKIQVDILGLSTSPVSGGAFALILKETNGNRRLPIIIGAFEAQSIAIELEGIKPPRPLTHDLIKIVVENMSASISEVVINELKEGTFYAKIYIDTITGGIEIDARPSDAIALAVRFGAPIYVDSEVMNEASFEPEQEEEQVNLKPQKESLSKEELLKKTQEDLEEAIRTENYEKAIKLRDEIKKIQMEG
jgi:uncharacterized protein